MRIGTANPLHAEPPLHFHPEKCPLGALALTPPSLPSPGLSLFPVILSVAFPPCQGAEEGANGFRNPFFQAFPSQVLKVGRGGDGGMIDHRSPALFERSFLWPWPGLRQKASYVNILFCERVGGGKCHRAPGLEGKRRKGKQRLWSPKGEVLLGRGQGGRPEAKPQLEFLGERTFHCKPSPLGCPCDRTAFNKNVACVAHTI